jgi:hypothetical protein
MRVIPERILKDQLHRTSNLGRQTTEGFCFVTSITSFNKSKTGKDDDDYDDDNNKKYIIHLNSISFSQVIYKSYSIFSFRQISIS